MAKKIYLDLMSFIKDDLKVLMFKKRWLIVFCVCKFPYLYATNYNWNVIPQGVGFWNSGYYWNGGGGSYPDSTSDAAYFTSDYTGPVTAQVLNGSFSVGSITVNPTFPSGVPYNVEIASPGTLAIGSSSGAPGIFWTGFCDGSLQTFSRYTMSTPIDLSVSNITISENTNFNDSITGNISGPYGIYLTTNNNAYYHLYLGNSSTVNTYAGGTVLASGYLSLGSNAALSPNSYLMVNGTLLTSGYSNTVTYLTGSGTIQMSHGEILTITNGNSQTFSGSISGTGGLSINAGSLNIGVCSYTGPTTIAEGATLQAIGGSSFSSNSVFTVDGTLALNGYGQTISSLTGSGEVIFSIGEYLSILNGQDYVYSGTITGNGGLALYGENLILAPSEAFNDYTQETSLPSGVTLTAGALGAFSSNSLFILDGTLDLNGYDQTIGSLQGSGTIIFSSGESLTISDGASNFYSGMIEGLGDLSITTGNFTLSPPSLLSYTGTTTVDPSAVLWAGNSFAFSSNSLFTVNGTLALNGYGQTISSLNGSGSVDFTSGEILSINDGQDRTYSGVITGNGGVSLYGGTLTLAPSTGANDYTQTTLISTGATLKAGGVNAYSSNSAFNVNGTLALNGYDQTIGILQGAGEITFLAGESLTISNGSGYLYAGSITGTGSLLLDSGSLTLSPELSPNTYTGITNVPIGATLIAGMSSSFSPNSFFQVDGTLNLANFSNTIGTLSGSGSVLMGSATLTLDQDVTSSFSGEMAGSGGNFVLNQGNFSLTTPQSYTGSTTIAKQATLNLETTGSINASQSITVDGVLNVLNIASIQMENLFGSGQVLLGSNIPLELLNGGNFSGNISGGSLVELLGGNLLLTGTVDTTQYEQQSLATLSLGYSSFENPPVRVAASDQIFLAGSLIVEDQNSPSIASPKTIVLMEGVDGRVGTFSHSSFQGFTDLIPILSYTSNAVQMTLVPAMSASSALSLGPISFGFINGRSLLVQRNQHFLHQKMMPASFQKRKELPLELKPSEETEEKFNDTTLFAQQEEPATFASDLEGLFAQEEHERIELTERIQEEKKTPWRIYAGPIESLEKVDLSGSFFDASISAQSTGFFSGFDYAFSTWGVGCSASYVSTWGDGPRGNSQFQFDQSQLAFYTTYLPMEDKALAVNAIGGFGFNEYHLQRVAGLDFSKTAKSHFGAFHYNLLLGAEYSFSHAHFSQMPAHFLITPMLNLQYSQIFTQSHEESGAGLYNLKVGSIDPNSLTSLLALRFDLPFSGENWQFKTEIDLGWQYQMLSQKENLSLTVTNLPTPQHFSVPLQGDQRNSLWVGCDLFLTAWDHFQVEGSYDLQYNKSFIGQNFYLGFGGTF